MIRRTRRSGAWTTAALAMMLTAASLMATATATAASATVPTTVPATAPDNPCITGIAAVGQTGPGISVARNTIWAPDGSLWLPEAAGFNRMLPDGVIKTYEAGFPIQTAISGATLGADGNVWFADLFSNRVGFITPAGAVTWFSAGISANAVLASMTLGPDGNVWVVEVGIDSIARVTPAGVVTEFPVGLPSGAATGLISGPGGALWFVGTENPVVPHSPSPGVVGRMTMTGAVTLFSTGITGLVLPDIAVGPDGNLWYFGTSLDAVTTLIVGRITPTGVATEWTVPPTGPVGLFPGESGITIVPSIVAGPDGNLWFNDQFGGRIGKITTTGQFTMFSQGLLVDAGGIQVPLLPGGLSVGPDGNIWFNDAGSLLSANSGIGRITPQGVVTSFGTFRTSPAVSNVTLGPDGNIWYTAAGVGKVTPAGIVTEFPLDTVADQLAHPGLDIPIGITAGPDGNVWFTQPLHDRIGRITTAGVITWFSTGITAGSFPNQITAGPDGNVWFTEKTGHRIGRITPAGVVTEFATGNTGGQPVDITTGPDGNLWFTDPNPEAGTGKIGKITPQGQVTEFDVPLGPSGLSGPVNITAGPDGNLWFTDGAGVVGKVTPAGVVTIHQLTPTDAGLPQWEGVFNGLVLPQGIVSSGGALWVTVPLLGRLVRVTTDGQYTGYDATAINGPDVSNLPQPLPLLFPGPAALTTGADGSLWFTGKTFQVNHVGCPTTTTLSASPTTTPAVNQPVTFTAQVSSTDGNPTGQVGFYVDGSSTPAATVTLDGSQRATFMTTFGGGSHSVVAKYLGTATFLPSTSNTVSIAVGCTTTISGGTHAGFVASSGTACVLGATISGAITVSKGATLDLENAKVTGAVVANSPATLRICGSTIGGSVTASGATGVVRIGDPANGCAANTVSGSIIATSNKGGGAIVNNTLVGALTANSNTPAFTVTGNHH